MSRREIEVTADLSRPRPAIRDIGEAPNMSDNAQRSAAKLHARFTFRAAPMRAAQGIRQRV